ncbi:hypothetical protein VMCG_01434 [Cytospora schulzeri]|uniref:Uncharacterized protein n=1 Tax=Cytospora schulzeri TaxID=448051 RepID=A0A423X788_9PEZI|nr:hypothetical protein VMCG_01434 [Valsa malicola]
MPSHDAPSSGSSSSQRDNAPDAQSSNSQPRTEQELSQTAAALEANLTSLESKLDELLASFMSTAGEEPHATNSTEKNGKAGDDAGAHGGQDTTDK